MGWRFRAEMRVDDLGLRAYGPGFRILVPGLRVQGIRVNSSRLRV
jgi:hypothetical protein